MIEKRYKEWLNSDVITKGDKNKLKKMNKKEKEEAFYTDLEFGTAGIRGIMGLGTAKINKYTIGKVTVGFANYINKKYKNGSVVIAYDTRKNSYDFAMQAALILNYNNIKTYLFDEYTSTPELSFAIKYLKATNGIVITSSHNSKIYNGYKVYNEFGSQVVYPDDEEIINEVNKINDLNLIKKAKINNNLFNIVPEEEKVAFLEENKRCLINETLINKYGNRIKITYSSLHGVGIKPMTKLLKSYNLNFSIVKKQCKYDSKFTTAPEPNPEYKDVFNLAIKNAKRFDSDVIFLTDPDADRIGIMIKDKLGYRLLNGNLVGILFSYYIVTNSRLNKNNYLVRSLPSSMMVDAIAKKYKIKIKEVLTGCKNIAVEKEKDELNYLFGYEESLGYVFNIDINDKNGFTSTIFFIELLCYCKSKKITISDYIEIMYKDIGYYYDYSTSIVFEGINGKEKMNNLMNNLRNNIIEMPLYKEKIDYISRNDNLKTNALKYIFVDNSYLVIRPSGTEPKIKLYFGSFDTDSTKSLNNLETIKNRVIPLFK